MSCYVMLFYVTMCYVILCYVMLHCAVLRSASLGRRWEQPLLLGETTSRNKSKSHFPLKQHPRVASGEGFSDDVHTFCSLSRRNDEISAAIDSRLVIFIVQEEG